MREIKETELAWYTADECIAKGLPITLCIRSRFKRKHELDFDGNSFDVTYTEYGYLEKNSRCSKCGE